MHWPARLSFPILLRLPVPAGNAPYGAKGLDWFAASGDPRLLTDTAWPGQRRQNP
jgi:hypothetical protein